MAGDPSKAGLWPDADVYVAPLGTEVPTIDQPFGAGWDLVGLLDGEAGYVHAREEEVEDHYAWGGILVRTSRRNYKQTITFTALEDNPVTRALVWPQSAVGQVVVPRPERVLVAFEVREDEKVKRLITAYQAEVNVSGDITDAEGDLTRYELVTTVFPTAEGVLFEEQKGQDAIAESFDSAVARTSPGPDLQWLRQVFFHAFNMETDGDEVVLNADAAGSWEDLWVPSPNLTSTDVEITMPITSLTRALALGADDYVIDIGAVVRMRAREGGADYRGYAAGIGRNNIFLAPGHTWHLAIFQVDDLSITSTLLDIAIVAVGDVALPGVFTFTADGPNLTATFTHSGTAPTMEATAVDATYTDGHVALGGSVVLENGADEGTIKCSSFSARNL